MALIGVLGLGAGAIGGFGLGRSWPLGPNWITKDYDFDLDLPSPFVAGYQGAYEPSKPVDDEGIVITEYQGERVYHPVDSCWHLFPQLHSFEVDRDGSRLDSVRATTEFLLDGAEVHRVAPAADGAPGEDSLWFPYHFKHSPGDLDNGLPWYSGMAQGMLLSHLVRLHEVTGEQAWMDSADQVFNSFRHYRDGRAANESPWFVSFVDDGERRSTVFEEYPSNNPAQLSHVVNGNLYAMWGVYDYLRATGDRYARTILSRALASLSESFSAYRAQGHASLYGTTPWSYLTWGNPENYHRGVSSMLRRTAQFTRDESFETQAAQLAEDTAAFSAEQPGD